MKSTYRVFLLAMLALAACERQPPASRPDIVLVTIDTLRADHCSCYGYPVPTTPVLDRLATQGIQYRNTYAECSTTAPSHAVLLTGRHFRTMGVTKNGGTVPPDAVMLAETLRDAGYATAAFVSSFPLMSRFGFAQGFDAYDDTFTAEEASIGRRKEGEAPHDRVAAATVAHLERWLEARSDDRPLFLWVHFVDPHYPYRPPERFAAEWPQGASAPVQRYDSEVHYADEQMGHALEAVAKHTPAHEDLIVVTSDHGEGLGDHGWMSHGVNLHEEVVRVPLVVSWRGHLPEGSSVDGAVALIDVAPGILSLLGIHAPTFSHGRDLFAQPDPDRAIFMQRREYKTANDHGVRIAGEMDAVLEHGRKMIVAPEENRRELYELAGDPGEIRDVLSKRIRRVAAVTGPPLPPLEEAESRARGLVDAIEKWQKAFPPAARRSEPTDKETLRALRSLGYVD